MNRTTNNVFLCTNCCKMIGYIFSGSVVSQCHKKFCWLCGNSSNSDLESYPETMVREKCNHLKIKLSD